VRIEFLTLFPEMLEGPLSSSILRRAQKSGLVDFRVHQLRDYARDRHRVVDDRPFGGGPGMILKCGPLVEAIEAIQQMGPERARVIYLTPQGRMFRQSRAVELSREKRLLLVSGHYEGIDERVRLGGWIDEELSIGEYVLTNGTIPALVVADAVTRLIPGVLGNEDSAEQESFMGDGNLDWPQFTRPEDFRGLKVPEVLLSGNHAAIAEWRAMMARERTRTLKGTESGE
jgi:tRNA (guanine37-N1)-methyltransferase